MCQPAWRRHTVVAAWFPRALFLIAATFLVTCTCRAQLPQAGDTTSPPTPGVGHDYIHSPVETVNPANGSVSIRIPVRIASGRELTIPFAIAYDSSGAFYYGSFNGGTPQYLTTTLVPFSQGGWSYPFPQVTYDESSWDVQNPETQKTLSCDERIDYVFQDATGNRHNLGLATIQNSPWVQYCGGTSQNILQGGEGPILATTGGYTGPVVITDGNGTVYSGSTITDRNGNVVTVTLTGTPSATMVDTAGRTALNIATFGSNPDNISVAGLGSPYKVYWTTASASFNISVDNLGTAACTTSLANSAKVVSQIVLPNGQSYHFYYGTNPHGSGDPYGMLSEIDYPSGGYVRYIWGLHGASELPESGLWSQGVPGGYWDCRYDFPTITDRYVSFDGSTEVLHQHFSYSTTWPSGSDQYTSKTTTVTTTDNVRGTSFNTVYTYSSAGLPGPMQPDLSPNGPGSVEGPTRQMPVEQSIQYQDTNGHVLKTVTKSWANNDPRTMSSERTTLDNGQSSLKIYCYNSSEQVTEEDEYDYGTGTVTPPSCSNGVPSGTVAGALLRRTVTNYASFTGAHIVDLPSSVITYDGSGNRVAETDSSYDQTGLQPTSVVQHSSVSGARGNLTTVTKDCFVGSTNCTSGNPTTTYSYYDTGQIYQLTDPNNHITIYSYTDSYSSCGGNAPPAGATNAYLTQVTYPQTGTISHIESYCYDYSAGLLRGSTDENGQASTYTYADSLDRLTQANYPDTGQTLVSYNDIGPTPSVTTEKKLDTSGRFVTTVSTTNGMGLPIETDLTSDPQGTDTTKTTYDGLGRALTVTNPYRSTGDPTYGFTSYIYDALGRKCLEVPPDGTSESSCPSTPPAGDVFTQYAGNCTTVTDEAGKNRESCTDGLGRMTEVIENPGGLGYVTNYTYDALDDLTSVVQGGSRNRSFTYDSLKRMTQSTNPESGTINYAYDAAGNVSTKTDARSITTTYSYDALNRVTGMTYSNGDPSVSYTYDQSACLGQPACYNIGHRTTMTDAGGNEEFAYDPMGREIAEQRTTNSVTRSFSYSYDPGGDMKTLTYASGRTITYTYDSAGRPSEAAGPR